MAADEPVPVALVTAGSGPPAATSPQFTEHGTAELRSCIQALVALSDMPAWWAAQPPAVIAETLCDLLADRLRAAVHVRLEERRTRVVHHVDAGRGPGLGAPTVSFDPPGSSISISARSPRSTSPSELERLFVGAVAKTAILALEQASLRSQLQQVSADHQDILAKSETARAEAERTGRAKSNLLLLIGHELRTPLHAIIGYIDLLEIGVHGQLTERQRLDLGHIRHSHQYLVSIINSVLEYARAEGGVVEYDIRPLVVEETVATVEELIRPILANKGLRYIPGRACPGVRANADREKLQQILLNLLSNAAKFTNAGGSVWLHYRPAGGAVVFRVADTGRGIPADKLEAVFEPFVRLGAGWNATEHVEGTGLGLAISRQFAAGMGGRLRAKSWVDRGTTFTLTVPRQPNGEGVARERPE